jgi:hypothetical protein
VHEQPAADPHPLFVACWKALNRWGWKAALDM